MNLFEDAPKQNPATSPQPAEPPLIILGMPTLGSISFETFSALRNCDEFTLAPIITARMPVALARNTIAKSMLIEADQPTAKEHGAFCLWVDSDSWWPVGTIAKAVDILKKNPQVDLLAASFSRTLPFEPRAAWLNANEPDSFVSSDDSQTELVEVERVGFHWVMHRTELLRRVGTDPFSSEAFNTKLNTGEDFAFCQRVREKGGKLCCAVRLIVAHVEVASGACYIPDEAPLFVQGNRLCRPPKKVHQTHPSTANRPSLPTIVTQERM